MADEEGIEYSYEAADTEADTGSQGTPTVSTRKAKIAGIAKKLFGDKKRYSSLAHGTEKAGLLIGRDVVKAQKLLAEMRLKQLQGYEKSGYKLTPDEEEMKRRLQAIEERDENLKVMMQKKLDEMKMSKEEQIARALKEKANAEKKLKELLAT